MSEPTTIPATLWQRAKAFALDYLIIAGYLVVVVILGVWVNGAFPQLTQTLFDNPLSGQVTGFVLVTLPVTLYYALSESSSRQATWGKRKIGLRVVSNDGAPLTFAHAFGRTLLKFIPWELSHTLIWQLRFAPPAAEPLITMGFVVVWLLVAINLISLLINKKRQTLYDWLAGTTVVRG